MDEYSLPDITGRTTMVTENAGSGHCPVVVSGMYCGKSTRSLRNRVLTALCPAFVTILLLLGSLGSRAEEAASSPASLVLPLSADKTCLWRQRSWQADGTPADTPLKEAASGEKNRPSGVTMPLKFPGKQEFVRAARESWMGWCEIEFEFLLPGDLPADTILYITTQDDDYLWRQVRMKVPAHSSANSTKILLPIAGPKAAARWEMRGHQRPWHGQTPRHLLEFGCSFELEKGDAYTGTVQLLGTRLMTAAPPPVDRPVRDLHFSPRRPEVGKCWELTFALDQWVRDPFDPESVSVRAKVSLPSGGNVEINGFYFEDFLYDPRIPDKTKVLMPYGEPVFKVRYAPTEPGQHAVDVEVRTPDRTVQLPQVSFYADPPPVDYRGFLRRDPDNCCFLQWDDGTHFWALGMNVRSPYDTRYIRVAPYSTWQNEGLPMYERLFEQYSKCGIEVVEVWMSSWWLALEWINDAPGFHGVGTYNQYRAWMLDEILRLAEKHGIYIILVFNNHGKFGALNDTEWARNPFNTANGGFLGNCEEYFSNDRAKKAFKRLCDYIVARWGYANHILMWKLFTEVDLTGTSYDFYTQPVVAEWHREMGSYLKQIDVNHHLVTTHWMLGYYRINDGIAQLPELDLLTTDAYYQGGGSRQLLTMLIGGTTFARGKQKPLLITEYGGSPHADTMGNLIKQAHLGIWTGFFHESPAAPMFWWFALVDEKDLYSYYTTLHRFSFGEDRRGLTSSLEESSDPPLVINQMRASDRLYVWGFDAAYYLAEEENLIPATYDRYVLKTSSLTPGDYIVEFWDCATGTVEKTMPITTRADAPTLELTIPPFSKDFALKIKPSP